MNTLIHGTNTFKYCYYEEKNFSNLENKEMADRD